MYRRNAQGWSKHVDFFLIDEVSLHLAFVIAALIRFQRFPYHEMLYRGMIVVLALIDAMVLIMFDSMHNVLKRGYFDELLCTIRHCVVVFAVAAVYMYAVQMGDLYSRILLFLTLAFHILLGYITRILWKWFIKKHGSFVGKKVTMLVVLDHTVAQEMMQKLLDNCTEGYRIVGAILDEQTDFKEVHGIPIVSSLDQASEYISREWVDAVYIDCAAANPKVRKLMKDCALMGIPVHYHVLASVGAGNKNFVEKIGNTVVLTSSINYSTPVQSFMKRCVDIAGGIFGSLLAIFVIMIVGPMIKIASPGPILYKQERIGKNGKRFQMLKLRSMHVNADQEKEELLHSNRVKDGRMFKLDWDPRIIGNEILADGSRKTGIGELLRRTSLDELPQFFNVLAGQMSLVGTRPPTPDEWEKYEYRHRARLACKPGITGLWQVSGRSEITDFEEVVRLDLKYITEWSIVMDLKILMKTFAVVFSGRGAF